MTPRSSRISVRATPPASRLLVLVLVAAGLSGGGCVIFPQGAYWPSYDRDLHGRSLAACDSPAGASGSVEPLLEAKHVAALQENIARRWSDEGLADSARRMSAWNGRWVYGESLRTVNWFYVEPVSYRNLVVAGLVSLRAALANPTFAERFPEATDAARRREFGDALDALILEARDSHVWLASQASGWVDRAMKKNRETLGLPDGAVLAEMLFGAMDSLDPYTRYLTPEMTREASEQYHGAYTGIGVTIAVFEGRVFIATVMEGGAAAAAGLEAGDEIVAIEAEPVAEMTVGEVVEKMRGPAGTPVTIRIRKGGQGEPRDLALIRRKIYLSAVRDEQILDSERGIAYVRLASFTPESPKDLRRALKNLRQRGAKALILDLRGNPGGSLLATVDVAGLLLDGGRVASTKGRMLGANWTYNVPFFATCEWTGPLAVLVDGDTASAAEILAAALERHKRAVIVGRRTFGKGAAQVDMPVTFSSAAVTLTIARVYDPDGVCLEGRGVSPDVEVARPEAPPRGLREDPDVRAAVECLGRAPPP